VKIRIPDDAAPGTYTGSITVHVQGWADDARLPMTMDVCDTRSAGGSAKQTALGPRDVSGASPSTEATATTPAAAGEPVPPAAPVPCPTPGLAPFPCPEPTQTPVPTSTLTPTSTLMPTSSPSPTAALGVMSE
jgi:hypothetical protein